MRSPIREAARLALLLAVLGVAGSAAFASPSLPAYRDGVAASAVLVRSSDALINFDNLSTGGPGGAGALVRVNSQFAAQGVTFNNVSAIDYSKGPSALPGFAHSGTVAVEQCVGVEFCKEPVTATFTAAQQRVEVWVGFSLPLSQALRVQLKALDAASTVIGTVSATLPATPAATRISVPLRLDAGSARVRQIQVSIAGGFDNGLAVDDVKFTTTGPPPPCSATSVPAVHLDLPTDGLVVRTDQLLLQGSVSNGGAPIESASTRAEGNTGHVVALFPTLIGPGGGSFGPVRFSGLLSPGSQTIIVTATNCLGTGMAQAVVVWCQPGVPVSGSARVSTYAELEDALATCKKDIWVENSARIYIPVITDHGPNPPDYVFHIPDGVTLASGRSPTENGGLLYMSARSTGQPNMLDLGANTHITGLRLRGYNAFDTTYRNDPSVAILIRSVQDVLVDNNEIWGWPKAAVDVEDAPNDPATAERIRITGNYIHNNVQCNFGYGVVVGGTGFAYIDRNVFDFNRHDVAGDGQPGTGYIAELNFNLTSGPTCKKRYNQHFDMHGWGGKKRGYGGTGGQYVLIRRNTIRGDQTYGGLLGIKKKTRPAFELRGTPTDRAIFSENAVAHDDEDAAVRIKVPDVTRKTLKRRGFLEVRGNTYNVDTSLELDVGDFNGDGRADVFQATGAVWAYSPSGRREWHVLNYSGLRLDRLALGDFNGDGKTDVFSRQGDQWLVSYGGTSAWTPLHAGPKIDMHSYRFGDFDGDRKTDVFRANGSHFYYSSSGATAWRELATSRKKIGELRLGDFDGDGKTDVFSLANGQWSVSYGGTTQWRRLNQRLSSHLGELVFADFNGDRRTDVARGGDDRWVVSYGGTTPWRTLNTGALAPLTLMLLGDFTGDRRADVLPYRHLARFKLSGGGVSKLMTWSVANMN